MSDLIKRDDALRIVDVAEDEHPYKVPGLFVTYSEYNQGWSDAVDFIRNRMEKADSVPAAPRWVRCEDELPPMLYQAEGDDFCIDYSLLVLAYRETSHDFCLARLMDDGHGATFGTDDFDELYGVTHWMPIDPPKEGV